ncbi:hypothetical protein GV827_11200 [Sulfitobacter sp. JBTF-M27]|uniref:Uncharacterized protein n=1 Tax=Sulfitobacter sediminilitoris TaxID=2698830 RepID=A0A6P0CCR6_9RHOB|nr:hypothetical protein [Sulfitobacter sediminilitoris]NEK22968.1 hypothetical protein [Sulfitobacter sediminilitoris]
MSYSPDDWRKAITSLIKKTSKNEITWELSDLFKADAWTEVDRSYQCPIKDKKYVVSETRGRHYVDDDEFYWTNGNDFSIFSSENFEEVRLASAPSDMHVIGSLFSAAEANYIFNKNVLGDLLEWDWPSVFATP